MVQSKAPVSIFSLTLLFSFATAKSPPFYRSICPTSLRLQNEKLSHFHFYFQDIFSGPNKTDFIVTHAQINTSYGSYSFGRLDMIDNPLTLGPELGSKLVGKLQGIYGSADLDTVALMMVTNFFFTEGKYNGSTLSLLGRNHAFSTVRELPIVGGSGALRFARGYARLKQYSFDLKTGNAVVECNIHVFHY